jgi:hypothetical protein
VCCAHLCPKENKNLIYYSIKYFSSNVLLSDRTHVQLTSISSFSFPDAIYSAVFNWLVAIARNFSGNSVTMRAVPFGFTSEDWFVWIGVKGHIRHNNTDTEGSPASDVTSVRSTYSSRVVSSVFV